MIFFVILIILFFTGWLCANLSLYKAIKSYSEADYEKARWWYNCMRTLELSMIFTILVQVITIICFFASLN